ncbi:MAG: glycosyltransferase [Saccharofermentans sp.]|nr:glycosyltransferase [Saccharofermentans sp.]
MKVLQINTFGNLSTGKIAVDIYRTLRARGHEGAVAFARNEVPGDVPSFKIGNPLSVYTDGVFTRLTDKAGHYSKGATEKLIKQIKEYDPDIIHLHNLHGYYINVPMLFDYLKDAGKPVVWTLHDCWAYTGHCCYYSMAGCEKWKTHGCSKCPQKKAYPASIFKDNSSKNFSEKNQMFHSVKNLHLVCVSKWLDNELKASFLKDIPSRVIYNGIDTSVFKPSSGNFRIKYNVGDKRIVLGVASTWDTRKGLADFIELSKILDERYKIVLVGLNDKQKASLPDNMIGIGRTDGPKELAEIYSASNVLFNASVEETFGLPNVESLACGTPVVAYNCTGIPETMTENDGYIVEPHDLKNVALKIGEICDAGKRIEVSSFRFPKDKTYEAYMKLYEELV